MLKTGSSGDDVTRLQKRLAASGFDPGGSDGVFGPKTEAALKAFQESAGITADGIAGPQTNAKLAEAQAKAMEKLSNLGKADEGDAPAPL
jgi:peptidoglycan hydrolase-like protein with peptidoglycan-binding domain